ncbi:unnamed protein product [Ixodes hexagonus]
MEISNAAESEVRLWLTELYPGKEELVPPVTSTVAEENVTSIPNANHAKQPVCTSASKIDDALRRKLRKKKHFSGERNTNASGSQRTYADSGQVNEGFDDDCDSKVGSIKKPRNLVNSGPQNVKTIETKHLSKSAKRRLNKRLQKKADT